MNTADYLLQNAEDHRIALVDNRSQYTYKELKAASSRILGELLTLDVRDGDRVAILADNSLFWGLALGRILLSILCSNRSIMFFYIHMLRTNMLRCWKKPG